MAALTNLQNRNTTSTADSATREGGTALALGLAFCVGMTALIWLTGDWLVAFAKPEDQGPFWYYWHLAQPSLLTRSLAWGSYALHQLFAWSLIAYAQRNVRRYTPRLHTVNVIALAGNALFVLWHYVHGHIWYDKLAQDTSIFSSQGSVILMLVWILLMENPRRGLFFGRKIAFSKRVAHFAKKYHGYVFSWAIVYTFWYHPVENTPGHLVGFFYMFMLMLQGSLFYTRMHINRWWMVVQEVAVLIHGGLVAHFQGNGMWHMFVWGFATLIIVTQMHGLGLSRLWKLTLIGIYTAGVLGTYGYLGMNKLNVIIRIPLIEYGAALVLAVLIWLGFKMGDGWRKWKSSPARYTA